MYLSLSEQAPEEGHTEENKNEDKEREEYCIHWVEACGLVTLCSYRSVTRRLSLVLLKEIRSLHEALTGETDRVSSPDSSSCGVCVRNSLQREETPVMDVIESATPVIIKRYLSTLSVNQRVRCSVLTAPGALSLSLFSTDRAAGLQSESDPHLAG